MQFRSVKYYGDQSSDKNLELLKKFLPANSVLVNFKENPFFKGFVSHFGTLNNLKFVQDLVYKLAELRIADNNAEEYDNIFTDQNLITKRCLFISTTVAYSRIFNSPKGKSHSFSIKDLIKEIPEDLIIEEVSLRNRLLVLHEKVMQLRNKYIAHTDDSHFEEISAFVHFNLEGNGLEYSIRGIYLGIHNFDEEEIQDWIMLLSLLVKKHQEKLVEQSDLFFKNFSREELLRLAGEAGIFTAD